MCAPSLTIIHTCVSYGSLYNNRSTLLLYYVANSTRTPFLFSHVHVNLPLSLSLVVCLVVSPNNPQVHRAFNYSSTHSCVVLIVDIARPSHLPTGTATGGHTEELDKFIDQLN